MKIRLMIIGVILIVGVYNYIERKPFKFESFATTEEAQEYFNKNYPIGSDIEILLEDLRKVGVEYVKRKEKIPPQQMGEERDLEYEKVYVGDYGNNWVSANPMGCYDIYIFVDKADRIVYIDVLKWSKFS